MSNRPRISVQPTMTMNTAYLLCDSSSLCSMFKSICVLMYPISRPIIYIQALHSMAKVTQQYILDVLHARYVSTTVQFIDKSD